jgi:hypothetical protein
MAVVIYPNGNITELQLSKNQHLELKTMYYLLECSMVQAIPLNNGRIMWIDEEGKFKPHRLNPDATRILHVSGGMLDDYIAGTALITEESEVE